ncbi:carbonic anhydrase [Lentzea sp. E54]|uniref:carbonic anhydrase n=1 Tax=Lentzea xerophila TaxID=3435883 RepID=UPI003DA679BC
MTLSACAASNAGGGGGTTSEPPATPPDSPRAALEVLIAGNKRLVRDGMTQPHTLTDIRTHVNGQRPFAHVVGCADSRVPPEAIFDQSFSDLFVTRTAGNVLCGAVTGTIEFGVSALGVSLILVLGHSSCGAVKAAVDVATGKSSAPGGELGLLVADIEPAARRAIAEGGTDVYADALKLHLRHVADAITGNPVVAAAIAAGRAEVRTAWYDLATAEVKLYE